MKKLLSYFIPGFYLATVPLSNEYAFGNLTSLGGGLSFLVPTVFLLATAAVTIYLLYAGFKFLTSGGDKESLASARAMITHSVIAFLMLILLFLVLKYIPEFFGIQLNLIQ